jgi:hypothetical protein
MPDTGKNQAEGVAIAKRSAAYLMKTVTYKKIAASSSWHDFRLGGGDASIRQSRDS